MSHQEEKVSGRLPRKQNVLPRVLPADLTPWIQTRRRGKSCILICGLLLLTCLAGCVHGGAGDSRAAAVQTLQDQLTALSPSVEPMEAQRVAVRAYDASRQLEQDYRIVKPALFHNFLVNLGLKQRGLCYHWAEDLTGELEALQLTTLELHWGVARHETRREHNCVVITALDQPFAEGLVLDAWRRSGRLVCVPVSADHYPWVEGWQLPPP